MKKKLYNNVFVSSWPLASPIGVMLLTIGFASYSYESLISDVVLESKVNCKFISQKKFFLVNSDDVITFEGDSFFKPIIGEKYFYGYAGIGQDYYMLTAEMKDVENIMDKEIIKVYIQFKNFFLIKGYDEVIYIIDNNEFKDKLNESEFPMLILQALNNEKFFEFQNKLVSSMSKELINFNIFNENICIGFKYKNIFLGFNPLTTFIKNYVYDFPDMKKDYNIVEIWIFKDIILMHDNIHDCIYIYKNIFSLYIIKDKDLFFKELLNFIDLDFEKYKKNKNNLVKLDKK